VTKITLSQDVFEKLVQHLVEAEEEKNRIFDQYLSKPSRERIHFENLFDEYIRKVNDLIKNTDKSQASNFDIPFVTIGSVVKVQDLTDQEVLSFRIVNPFEININTGDISCLSPVGKSLLLKKVDDEIVVNAPGGVFRYKILSIQLRDFVQ